MNLFQLRAFDAVAREGSFTRAAARLFISQPTLAISNVKTVNHTRDKALITKLAVHAAV